MALRLSSFLLEKRGGDVPNEKNLIPLNKRDKETAKRIRQKGQAAQAETRRKRKALKDSMNALLELVPPDARDYNKLVRAGIPLDEIDNSQLIVLALFNRAKAGDVAAIKELRDLIGEDNKGSDIGQLESLIRGLCEL